MDKLIDYSIWVEVMSFIVICYCEEQRDEAISLHRHCERSEAILDLSFRRSEVTEKSCPGSSLCVDCHGLLRLPRNDALLVIANAVKQSWVCHFEGAK